MRSSRVAAYALAGALLVPAPGLSAQAVPEPSQVLGYEIGSRFTDVAGVQRYVEALAAASELVSVDHYGETPEGRPLLQVLFASPADRARLDAILDANRELADPDTSPARSTELARRNPAVVYLTFGVHGNESGSSEAALLLAHDLASGAAELAGVLDSLIVVMDPAANPDGRDRYVNYYRQSAQGAPNPNLQVRSRREPWPGGRYNHYLFDLNRDWAWLIQEETRARLERFQRYRPQVHVDFHEMGYRASYFFFPAADPISSIYPETILAWGERFGEANARAMDRAGLLYFTGQRFDLVYRGYGDCWPSLVGTVGMTFEQGGGGFAGRAVRRPDGTVLTLEDRIVGHRTTAAATLRTAAAGKTGLLESYAEFHRTVDESLDDIYLVPGPDPSRLGALVELLDRHSIQTDRLTEETAAPAEPHPGFGPRETFPVGTVRVRARQPHGRLAVALLRPDNFLEPDPAPSDITAWALPYAYGVEAHSADGPLDGSWAPVESPSEIVGAAAGSASPSRGIQPGAYGYLLSPSFAEMPALVRFLVNDGRALVLADSFAVGSERYPPGTVFIPRARNADLAARLDESGLGTRVTPVTTGRTTEGPDLGTGDAASIVLPRVALLGGEGTAPTGFGAHWHFLERVLRLPFDPVNVEEVDAVELEPYDVIVVPPGDPVDEMGEAGIRRLDDWIRRGGTLVAVAGAARGLGAELVDVEVREEDGDPGGSADSFDPEDPPPDPIDRALRPRSEREADAAAERTAGTILEAALDPQHPLSFGVGTGSRGDRAFILSWGQSFEPSESFESPVFFPQGVARISGVMSERNLERLDRSAWAVEVEHGDGRVILFSDDPLFRGFWYSGRQLMTNALLFASAF